MSAFVKVVLWVNVAVLTVLAVMYAHLMISPGPLSHGHRGLETDCFVCHTPLLGASSQKCAGCHKPEAIGLFTTKGLPIVKDPKKPAVAFHQKLTGQDCVACHSDHAGMSMYRIQQRFSHALLDVQTRGQCVACHKTPADKVHEKVSEKCADCHTTEKWKPATFKHELLPKAELEQCFSCHKKPTDKLHEMASEKCGQCHKTEAWKPAFFKHDLLPRAELEQCFTCHKKPFDKVHENASDKCGQCHKTDKWKPAFFKHDLLPRTELRQCVNCHLPKMPNDQRHRDSSKRCGNCHYTDRWEPAKERFNSSGSSPSNQFFFNGGGGWDD